MIAIQIKTRPSRRSIKALFVANVSDNTMSRHLRRTLVLAWPMILSRVGIIGMSAVDVIVLGRAGATELADYVLGFAVLDSLIAMTIGLMIGVPILVARESAAGNDGAVGLIWRRGLVFALLLCAPIVVIMQFSEPVFLASGQAPDLAARAAVVTGVLAFEMPFIAAYFVSASALEALHRPAVALVAVAIGNVVNLYLNIALVFGIGPIAPMGAVGCAIASVVTFALLAISLAIYIRYLAPNRERFGFKTTSRPSPSPSPSAFEQLRMGLALGGASLFEASSFTIVTLLVGWLGALALAAHGVLFQFLALIFMIAFGVAGATQVRVGNAWGRDDPDGVRLAGWTGLLVSTAMISVTMLIIGMWPEEALHLFSDDPAVIAAAAPVLFWVLAAALFDGGQAVMNQACRGRGDTWAPTAMHFGSYWLVMVPAAWALSSYLGHGLAGVYQAIFIASILSLTILALRFNWLTRQDAHGAARP